MRTNSAGLKTSGPATSTTPFTGAPAAVRLTAAATASETTGWILASGSRTVPPSVTPSARPRANSRQVKSGSGAGKGEGRCRS